jgi:methionine aminopeptidase
MAAGQEALLAGAKQLRGSVTVGEVSRAMDATIREHGYLPNRDYVGYRIGEQPTMPPEIPCAFLEGEAMPRKLRNGMVVVLVVIVHAGSPACHIFQDDPWNVRTKDGSRSALFSSMFEIDGNGARWLTEPIGDMQGRP